MMASPNPVIQNQLEQARRELTETRAEKARVFPPNPHPLSQPDAYPKNYSPEQIKLHNELNARIESLERRIEELQLRLYQN